MIALPLSTPRRALRRFTLALTLVVALPGCVTDEFCRTHNAAEFTPAASRFATMSVRERVADAERFNQLARRCNWEP